MWSQCGCDRNILKQCLRPGPCSLSKGAEFAHPVPRSHNTFVNAGDDLDAARVAAEGSAHRKRQRLVDEGIDRLGVSSARPAQQRASRILSRIARPAAAPAAASGPQKRTRSGRRRLGFRTGARRRRLGLHRCFPRRARFLDRCEHRHQMREPADRENLVHYSIEAGDGEPPLSWLLPRGSHQGAQAGARNIFDR